MPRFIYTGGTEFDGTEMPASVTMYGIKFIEGVAKDVLSGNFADDSKFQHAIAKLKTHQFFQTVNDEPGTLEVLEAPKAKRGRPAKVVADDAVFVEDAAE
jgi:hypothetical protein